MNPIVANTPRHESLALALLLVASLGTACGRSGLSAGADASPVGAGASSVGSTSASNPVGGNGGGGSSPASKAAGGNGPMGGTSALDGSGGAGSVGATSGSAGCPNVQACGGDVVGTWNVTSSCLTVTGRANLLAFGLTCTRARVEGALQVSGKWLAMADGTYADETTTTGSVRYSMDDECARLMGTRVRCLDLIGVFLSAGFSTAGCEDAAAGGCTCDVGLKLTGSMGTVMYEPLTKGTYKTSGSRLMFDDRDPYAYCLSEDLLTIAPQNPALPTTGAIVFRKQ